MIASEQEKYLQYSSKKEMKKALDSRNNIEKFKIKLQPESVVEKWEKPIPIASSTVGDFSNFTLIQLEEEIQKNLTKVEVN